MQWIQKCAVKFKDPCAFFETCYIKSNETIEYHFLTEEPGCFKKHDWIRIIDNIHRKLIYMTDEYEASEMCICTSTFLSGTKISETWIKIQLVCSLHG